ncbi:MAG TPA: glycosyl hydrolase-related protein, partial [Clostridia bacterium]|nr:glycosyl hydrolase-related protein [Clostridia bacterium]
TCNHENVIVDTLKKAEEGDGLILRVYECFNRRTECTIDLNFEVSKITECDLMENDIADAVIEDNVLKFTIRPYEIKTFKIS